MTVLIFLLCAGAIAAIVLAAMTLAAASVATPEQEREMFHATIGMVLFALIAFGMVLLLSGQGVSRPWF